MNRRDQEPSPEW